MRLSRQPLAMTTFQPRHSVQGGHAISFLQVLSALRLRGAQRAPLGSEQRHQRHLDGRAPQRPRRSSRSARASRRTGAGDRGDGDWNMGQTFPVDELAGLPANDDRFTVTSIKFDLRREAGTLAMEGAFRDGRGAGLFTFTPRPEYAAEMKSLGFSDDLPALAAVSAGAPRRRAALHQGAEGRGIRQAAARPDPAREDPRRHHRLHPRSQGAGFRTATLENLVRTRDHGVTGDFIKAMKAEGFTGTTLEEFVRTARSRGDAEASSRA